MGRFTSPNERPRRIEVTAFRWPPPHDIAIDADEFPATVRTHYNPAFWLALWNEQFFQSRCGRPREQRVQVLNLRADRVYEDTINDVNVEPNLGLAELKSEDLIRVAQHYWPPGAKLDAAIREFQSLGPTVLDNENFFSLIEKLPAYPAVEQAIIDGTIRSQRQKDWISVFLLACRFRHPTVMETAMRPLADAGLPYWANLLELRKLFGSEQWVSRNIAPLRQARWIFHIAQAHTFPLPDFPSLSNETGNHLWAALSPRLLLEIELGQTTSKLCIPRKIGHDPHKCLLENYRRLALQSPTREVLFHDRETLADWRMSPEGQLRVQELRDLRRKK